MNAAQSVKLTPLKFKTNGGFEELWLVSNPYEVQEILEASQPEHLHEAILDVDLDACNAARAAAEDLIILTSATSDEVDIPSDRDEEWLAALLERCYERDRVRDEVEAYWVNI